MKLPRMPIVLFVPLLLIPSQTTLAQAPPGRDWRKHPAIVEIDTSHEIYALGDVHGDYDRLVTLLVAAKLIAADPGPPEKVQWTGGKAVLVCTGDIIDKWDQGLRVIALFKALRQAAGKDGGNVVVTMGNHEAEFLADPTNKKAAEFLKELKANKIDPADVAAGKDALGAGEFLRSLPFAARVDSFFFCHAGNTHGMTLAKLQAELQQGVDKQGYKAPILLDPDSLLEARMHPQPWWEKPGDTAAASKERLTANVKALGVKHLVIGHQPGKVEFADKTKRPSGELFQKWDGLIIMLDVGMSRGVGDSTGAVLKIHSGKTLQLTALPANGPPKKLLP